MAFKITIMENILIGFIVVIVILTNVITTLDIWRDKSNANHRKFNLIFFVYLFPLVGSALYYSFFKTRRAIRIRNNRHSENRQHR